jgi:hypothetical protein
VIFLCAKFYENPQKSSGGVAKTKYFSMKMLCLVAITPLKIIGHGSPYNMHISVM